MPASRSACLATTLSMQRMQAPGREAVYGTPTSSSSSWTVPSSPPRPCRATNATSGRSAVQAVDEVGADVDREHVVAEPRQRVLDPRAGAQRDGALQRGAALEDRDLHEASRRRSGTTFSFGFGRGLDARSACRRARPARRRPCRSAGCPRGCRPRRRRRSSAAAPSRRGRRGTPRGRARRPRARAARAPAGRSCRCSPAAWPTRTARRRASSRSSRAAGTRPSRPASRRAGGGRSRAAR